MKCYLCGSSSLVQLTNQLRNGPGVVMFCSTCGLGMLEKKLSNTKEYYDKNYRKTHGPTINKVSSYKENFESYVNCQNQRIELLRPWLTGESSLLEVGCSTGHFLYNVKNLVGEVVGVDYDSGAADYASEICDCKTFGCGLDETDLGLESFDVVCAIQTMEHVEDPIGFVNLLGKYLKPNGILYIEVPNLYDPLLSVFLAPRYSNFYFHEAHILYFTTDSLLNVLKCAGFNGSVYFLQDYNFINALHWVLTGLPQPSCHEGLSSPEITTVSNIPYELHSDLKELLSSFDKNYKQLLAKYKVTDNIGFVGKRG